ncbi:MAG TPA: tetratricopeptide repeat protein [Terriglobia bacterium]|nr:tetratricopeptide repeat protein [Terriglobia bacterium]
MRDWSPGRRSIPLVNVIGSLGAVVRSAVPELAGLLLLGITTAYSAPIPQGASLAPGGGRVDPKKLAESTLNYERLVREHPKSAELWSNLGVVRAMAGNCAAALPALQRAESLNASLFNPWFFAGYCYFVLHQDRRATQSLQKATTLNPKDANAWFLTAQAEGNLDHLVPSFVAVVRSLELDPNRPEGYYLAGKTSLDLAQQLYSRVIAAEAPNPYELLLEGERNASQSVWKLALQDYQTALGLAPHSGFLQFALGSAFLESGRYAEAEDAFRESLADVPGSAWAKLRLGLALAKQGKSGEATEVCGSVSPEELELPEEVLDALRCASALNKDSDEQPLLGLARRRFPTSLQFAGWKGDSVPSGDKADLRSLTGPGLAFRFLLTAGAESGNFVTKAFPTLDKYQSFRQVFVGGDPVRAAAVAASFLAPLPSDPAEALALGEMLHCLSLGFYEHLAAASPDSTPAMMLAADNYTVTGQEGKALEIYQAILQREGPSPELLHNIARIYWTAHRWNEALKVLGSIASLDPNDATVFVNIGRIYSYNQDDRNAGQNFHRAVELDPKMFEAHLGLGEALRREGNLEKAAGEFRIAETLDPQYARTHYDLAQVYRKLGKSTLAEKEMAEFTRLQTRNAAQDTRRGRQLVPLD